MRRASDNRGLLRTGTGRRGRDAVLSGDPPENLRDARGDLSHLSWYAADDLRSAALSMSGLETYLITVHKALNEPGHSSGLAGLADADIDADLDKLERSLSSLRRTLRRIGRAGE